MKTTIHLRSDRVPNRHESDRVLVPAGWYEHAQFAEQRFFAPRQIGTLEGGYVDQRNGGAVLFVRVMAARDANL
jgi:hypothetical protein